MVSYAFVLIFIAGEKSYINSTAGVELNSKTWKIKYSQYPLFQYLQTPTRSAFRDMLVTEEKKTSID